jgi:TPR repeat protein
MQPPDFSDITKFDITKHNLFNPGCPPKFLDLTKHNFFHPIRPPSRSMLQNINGQSDQFVWHEGRRYRLVGMDIPPLNKPAKKVNYLWEARERPVYLPAKEPLIPALYTSFFAERLRKRFFLPANHEPYVNAIECLEKEAQNNEAGAVYLLATLSKQPKKDIYLEMAGKIKQPYPYYHYEMGRQAEEQLSNLTRQGAHQAISSQDVEFQPFDPAGGMRELVISNYETARALNHAYAVHRLGLQCLKQGDYRGAVRFFEEAVDKKVLPAQYQLGLLYEEGRGLSRNCLEALKWYQEAEKKGYVKAKERHITALQCLEELRNNEDPEAQFVYGYQKNECLLMEERPPSIEAAADQGHLQAKCLFTVWNIRRWKETNGSMYILEKVKAWIPEIEQAAEEVGQSQDNLKRIRDALDAVAEWKRLDPVCPLYRLGCDRLQDQQYEEAFQLFNQAAEFRDAQYQLGLMYEKGLGVGKDLLKARECYRTAAKKGQIQAKLSYYQLFKVIEKRSYFGRNDLERNDGLVCSIDFRSRALDYLQEAAESGMAIAQFLLGCENEYYTGMYRPHWTEKAADQGHFEAKCRFILWHLERLENGEKPMLEKVQTWIQDIEQEVASKLKEPNPGSAETIKLYKLTSKRVAHWRQNSLKKVEQAVGSHGVSSQQVMVERTTKAGPGLQQENKFDSEDSGRAGRPRLQQESKFDSEDSGNEDTQPWRQSALEKVEQAVGSYGVSSQQSMAERTTRAGPRLQQESKFDSEDSDYEKTPPPPPSECLIS